jgi:methyl-accepting chemotaxis protein
MVALLAITAVLGVVLLQETLAQLVQANDSDLAIVNQANDFLGYFRDARRNLHEMAIGHPNQLEQMSDSIVRASALLADIDNSPIVHHSVFNPTLGRIRAGFPKLKTDLAALATPAADLSVTHIESLISAMNVIDPDVGSLSGLVKDQAARDYQELSSRFRWQVLAFSVVSILVINLSVIALLRMGSMILRPVDMLVAAAREMGQENFSVRIELDSNDEFGQLAHSFNHMAEQLQASEKRRIEVLGQVALSMNHELNNLINIIELQCTLVSKSPDPAAAIGGHLKQIRQSLARMTNVVETLGHARRIVLTDYVAGMKMLDVQRSAQASDAPDEAAPIQSLAKSQPE